MYIYIIQTNTYEGIFITNGFESHALFTYECGEVQWSGLNFEFSTVGYNLEANYFDNNPANGFQAINEIVSCTVESRVNRKKRATTGAPAGCMMPANPDLVQAMSDCQTQSTNDMGLIADPNEITMAARALPPCPTTLDCARRDRNFRPHGNRGGNQCFRSVREVRPTGPSIAGPVTFTQVCCFTGNA